MSEYIGGLPPSERTCCRACRPRPGSSGVAFQIDYPSARIDSVGRAYRSAKRFTAANQRLSESSSAFAPVAVNDANMRQRDDRCFGANELLRDRIVLPGRMKATKAGDSRKAVAVFNRFLHMDCKLLRRRGWINEHAGCKERLF